MAPEDDIKVIPCSHCGTPLNVTGLSPYTLVECSVCKGFTRTFSVLGNYTITSRLGIGGMSLVFRAKDKTLGREVALKVLNQTYSSQPERVKKFEHEAHVMALVSHPNVVKIYSVGQTEGLFYIAMELVEGSNLESKIADHGALPERESLTIALEITEGLRAGYEAGVLHRDMKPANVLFNEKGEAQIVDFGLALLSGDQSMDEEIWATPHYAPPEVLERKPEDFRSDIYALGATLYHVFAGRPPISSDTQSIEELLRLKKVIPPLGEKMPALSEDTCLIVDRAMSYLPEKRFSSYEELIDALKRAALSLDKGTARTWGQMVRQQKRLKWKRTLIFSGGGLLLTGLICLLVIFSGSSPDGETNTKSSRKDIATNHPSSEELVRVAQRQAGEVYISARDFFAKGEFGTAAILYGKVFQNEGALPVTRIWAALEGYMSFLLNGEEDKGKDLLQRALESLEKNVANLDQEQKPLLELMKKLSDSSGLSSDECREFVKNFPPAYFLSALNSWERDDLSVADRHFREGGDLLKETDSDWDRKILSISKETISNLKRLETINNLPSATYQEAKEKRDDYANIPPVSGSFVKMYIDRKMETLERSLEKLKREEEELLARTEGQRASSEWKKGLALLKDHQYEQAKVYFMHMEKSGIPECRKVYGILASLCESSETFINYMATSMIGEGKERKVKSAKGGELVIKKVKSGQPVFLEGSKERSGDWSEIDPSSLLSLYESNQIFTREMEEGARRELEQGALSFAFLSGKKSEAGVYIRNLGQKSPEFAQEWASRRKALVSMGL